MSIHINPEEACIRADAQRQRERLSADQTAEVFARADMALAAALKGLEGAMRERVAVALLERVANAVAELKGGAKAQACLGKVAGAHGRLLTPRPGLNAAAQRLFAAYPREA